MNGYYIKIEIKEGKIQEIMDRLTAAQETIGECYRELEDLGVLTVTSGDDKKKSAAN